MENKILRYAITAKRPYFNLLQVQEIYTCLNGSTNGLPYFSEKAKEIAIRTKTRSYLFKDEEKLFFLLKEFFPEQ